MRHRPVSVYTSRSSLVPFSNCFLVSIFLSSSLKYLRIDPGISTEDLKRATEEVVEINLRNVSEDEDIWVTQRITRGLEHRFRSADRGFG